MACTTKPSDVQTPTDPHKSYWSLNFHFLMHCFNTHTQTHTQRLCDFYPPFLSLSKEKSIKHKAQWRICLSHPPEATSHTHTVQPAQMLHTWLQLHFQNSSLELQVWRPCGFCHLHTRFHWLSHPRAGWFYDERRFDMAANRNPLTSLQLREGSWH